MEVSTNDVTPVFARLGAPSGVSLMSDGTFSMSIRFPVASPRRLPAISIRKVGLGPWESIRKRMFGAEANCPRTSFAVFTNVCAVSIGRPCIAARKPANTPA